MQQEVLMVFEQFLRSRPRRPRGSAAPRQDELPSWEGCALPHPPASGGIGKPGFPMPLRGGGVGQPGFPTPLAEGVGSRETVMRMAHHAAMPMPWERGRPARIAAPRARRRPPP